MSDLFGNHIVGFPTRRLIYRLETLIRLFLWEWDGLIVVGAWDSGEKGCKF